MILIIFFHFAASSSNLFSPKQKKKTVRWGGQKSFNKLRIAQKNEKVQAKLMTRAWAHRMRKTTRCQKDARRRRGVRQ